jgi:hypothetical protein
MAPGSQALPAQAQPQALVRADRRLAATIEQWDADPMLLNTPAGVIDLRNGELRQHRSEDYMTMIATAGPRGDCPKWKAFLHRIMGGNDAMIAYPAFKCPSRSLPRQDVTLLGIEIDRAGAMAVIREDSGLLELAKAMDQLEPLRHEPISANEESENESTTRGHDR